MRKVQHFLVALVIAGLCWSLCAPCAAQELVENEPVDDVTPWSGDSANLEGCQVIARIDNQIVLACEVLWRVNQMIETHQQRVPAEQRVPSAQLAGVREQLMKREVASLLDRKLLYDQFRRNVPAENLPRIEESLREPFEERELPELMKQLKVDNQLDLERELARLGSSLADVQRAFNEKVIASEWIRSKVKINEEVSPDEMLEYYRTHLADYDYPTQARWEELMVRKSRFNDERDAYAELARLGNEVWQRGMQQQLQGPAFAEVAKAKSDGFTAKDGGVHDWTTKGALQATTIDEALFTLEVGQMSPVLDSGTSFHIVRVLERKEAGRKPFTDVQFEIRDSLKEERFKAGVEKYLTQLRQDARIWTAFTGNVSADVLLGASRTKQHNGSGRYVLLRCRKAVDIIERGPIREMIAMAPITIDIPESRLKAYCEKWKIRKLELFGSVLREDFSPESDVDVLATFAPDVSLTLFDLVEAEFELQGILGRPVDLLDRRSVEGSENWIRRRRILESARTIYAR